MSKFFGIDSPLMLGLTKLADLIILNFITIICCIPIITAGAALTAMHFVALKIVRDEESYILKTFFRSFKENFKQSTLLWLIHLAVIGLLVFDFMIIRYAEVSLPAWTGAALLAVTGLLFLLSLHIFPLQAKFINPIGKTIKNSVLVGIMTFPKTLLMGIIWLIPLAIIYFVPNLSPVLILLGVSGPAFLCALLYSKTFKKFEPESEITADADWHVEETDAEEISVSDKEGAVENNI